MKIIRIDLTVYKKIRISMAPGDTLNSALRRLLGINGFGGVKRPKGPKMTVSPMRSPRW